MTESKSIYQALAKAQSEFAPVVKNRKANYGRYADLGAILDAVRPALNRHGLFLRQNVTSNSDGILVETIISHENGESISSGQLFMPIGDIKGSKAQAFGSARTYACRYSLSSFLGVAADDDDDGALTGNVETKSNSKISTDLLQGAEDAVAEGPKAYEAYFRNLSSEARLALINAGYHSRFKNQLGI